MREPRKYFNSIFETLKIQLFTLRYILFTVLSLTVPFTSYSLSKAFVMDW